MSKPMQNRIRALAQDRGYSPNFMARSLRGRSTKTLGVIFPYATSPYYATLLDALYAETLKRGFHLEVSFHQWSAREETTMLRTMVERQVEGLILLPASQTTFATLEEMAPSLRQVPISLLGYVPPEHIPSCVRGTVYTDIQEGSRELGEFLLEMGHRHIALLSPNLPPKTVATRVAYRADRELGLRDALRSCPEAKLEVLYAQESELPDERRDSGPHSAAVDKSFELARQVADRFLKLSPRPTVAVTTNEVGAYVLIHCLQASGLRVPEDVSVACYDGTFLSEFGPVALTCVKQPLSEVAEALVDLVVSARGAAPPLKPHVQILKLTLVPRRSVARIN